MVGFWFGMLIGQGFKKVQGKVRSGVVRSTAVGFGRNKVGQGYY